MMMYLNVNGTTRRQRQTLLSLPVLVLVGCLAFLSGCESDSQSVALGTLERDRIRLSATASELVNEVFVIEGQQVTLGQSLLQLDDRALQAQLGQAKAELKRAEAFLRQLKNGARVEELASSKARVTSAEALLLQRSKNYDRAVALVAKKVLGQADLDRALAERDSADAALEDAREQLILLQRGTRIEELQQAQAQWQAATSGLALIDKQLSDLTVVATRSGVVDSLPWHLGERVSVGSPLVVLLAQGNPFVRAYIPEGKRASVKVGQTLKVAVDGAKTPFQGTISRLQSDPAFTPYYALTETDRARLMYLAEIQLGDDAKHLPSGLPAQVSLP